MFALIGRGVRVTMTAGLLSLGLSSGAAWAETWKCYTYHPSAAHAVFQGNVRIMERLKEATGGRIDHKCNVGGSLPIEANSIVPALGEGVIDFGTTGFVSGVVPVAGIVGLPGLFATTDEVRQGIKAAYPAIAAEFEKVDVTILSAYIYPRQVIWSKGNVPTLADLSGKSVRVTTLEQAEFVKAFNGVPLTIGTADVATSLQRGVFSVVLTAAAGGGRLWIDLLDHTSNIGPSFSIGYILASKEKFDSLSAEEQVALLKIADEEGAEITRVLQEENAALLQDYAANKGLTVTPENAEQEKLLTETMAPYWDTWAKERGDVAVKALADVREALGR